MGIISEMMEIKIVGIKCFYMVKYFSTQRFTPIDYDLLIKEGIFSVSQSLMKNYPVIIINK